MEGFLTFGSGLMLKRKNSDLIKYRESPFFRCPCVNKRNYTLTNYRGVVKTSKYDLLFHVQPVSSKREPF